MSQVMTQQRTTQNSWPAGAIHGVSAVRRSILSPPRPSTTFGSFSWLSNISHQLGEGATSASANIMLTWNTEDPEQPLNNSWSNTPLEYVNPPHNDNHDEPPHVGGSRDSGDPNDPNSDDPDEMVVKFQTHLMQMGLSRHSLSFLAVLRIYAKTMPQSLKKSKLENLILLMVPTSENSKTF